MLRVQTVIFSLHCKINFKLFNFIGTRKEKSICYSLSKYRKYIKVILFTLIIAFKVRIVNRKETQMIKATGFGNTKKRERNELLRNKMLDFNPKRDKCVRV